MIQILEGNFIPPFRGASLDTLHAMRAMTAKIELQVSNSVPIDDDITESVMTIPMRDGYQNEIRICKQEKPDSDSKEDSQVPSPLVVLIFGGGWALGTNRQFLPFARAAAALYSVTAVTLSYRLAPEYPFPTAPNDVWDSIQWLAANAAFIGADPSAGFIVGGGSAGANLSAVVLHRAIRENLQPPLTGIWACIPFFFDGDDNDSIPHEYRDLFLSRTQPECLNATCMDTESLSSTFDIYRPDTKSPDFSPFNDPASFAKSPPAYIQVAGLDPLRDDGLIYERTLRANGIRTKLDVYPGVPHGFFSAYPQLELSREFLVDAVVGIGWLLGKNTDRARAAKLIVPRTSV